MFLAIHRDLSVLSALRVRTMAVRSAVCHSVGQKYALSAGRSTSDGIKRSRQQLQKTTQKPSSLRSVPLTMQSPYKFVHKVHLSWFSAKSELSSDWASAGGPCAGVVNGTGDTSCFLRATMICQLCLSLTPRHTGRLHHPLSVFEWQPALVPSFLHCSLLRSCPFLLLGQPLPASSCTHRTRQVNLVCSV
ncbi:hypothetical protein BU23DRAFT_61896 [Bimuria novae-zelandiae CBS 107.79]|uniref:Uncharacterized protein n=1 Tax=Bimuria novae-zelandiae CBS 107.79 TaxID=1447943 RepID=A0A6A5UJI4_9PLEO|nr:hypothetical protein BU23DRAFT_61896 [Bimuria novae-zelandiae CBS 107.79]